MLGKLYNRIKKAYSEEKVKEEKIREIEIEIANKDNELKHAKEIVLKDKQLIETLIDIMPEKNDELNSILNEVNECIERIDNCINKLPKKNIFARAIDKVKNFFSKFHK